MEGKTTEEKQEIEFRDFVKNLKSLRSKNNNFSDIGQLESTGEFLNFSFTDGKVTTTTKFEYNGVEFKKPIYYKRLVEVEKLLNIKACHLFGYGYVDNVFRIGGNSCEIDEFPTSPEKGKIINKITITHQELKNVLYACSNDAIKPILNCVLFSKDGLVSTDSRRLEFYEKDFSAHGQAGQNFIGEEFMIKLSSLKLLMKQNCFEYDIETDDKNWFCVVNNTELTGELVVGTFPNYKQVLPKEDQIKVGLNFTVRASAILPALKRLKRYSLEPAYTLILKFENDKMRITNHDGTEENIIKYKADNFCFDNMYEIGVNATFLIESIGVNATFLIESIQRFKNSDIRFCFTGKMSPILLSVSSNLHSHYSYKSVIMPIQIKR